VVIHPDYCGLGLGIKCENAIAERYVKDGWRIMGKSSNTAIHIAKKRDPKWVLRGKGYITPPCSGTGKMKRKTGFRNLVPWKTYEYMG